MSKKHFTRKVQFAFAHWHPTSLAYCARHRRVAKRTMSAENCTERALLICPLIPCKSPHAASRNSFVAATMFDRTHGPPWVRTSHRSAVTARPCRPGSPFPPAQTPPPTPIGTPCHARTLGPPQSGGTHTPTEDRGSDQNPASHAHRHSVPRSNAGPTAERWDSHGRPWSDQQVETALHAEGAIR
jgi:hypothetical protein